MRLRRGGRNNETTADPIAATAPAVAGLPDEPGPIQPPPSGSVLGLSVTMGDGRSNPTNEWGFYDPDLAGIGALLSTLDTSAISFPADVEEDPSDLLLRHQTSTTTEPAEVFPAALLSDVEEPSRPSPAASAVASCRVGHLAPLSLWARVTDCDPEPDPRLEPDPVAHLLARRQPKAASRDGSQLAGSDLAAEIGRLTHPALVAMTGLSPVCRIRGIRTAPPIMIPEPSDELSGWPQPTVVPLPDAITVEALEELVAEAAEASEPAETQGREDFVARPVVAIEATQTRELPDVTPAPAAEVAWAWGTPEIAPSGQSPVLEPARAIDTTEDLTFAVAPPALDALPVDFIIEASPTDESPLQRDAELIGEAAPAAELPPPDAPHEPALASQAADETSTGQGMSPEVPVIPQVPAPSLPPQGVPQPVKRRRRTALALG